MLATTDEVMNVKLHKEGETDGIQFKPLEETLRPMITAMKLFGLFHGKYSRSEILPENEQRNLQNANTPWQRIYCVIVCVVLALLFIKCIPAFWIGFDYVDGLLSFRVTMAGWFLLCGMNGIIMFIACHKADHLHSFFTYYNAISSDKIAKNLQLKTNCRIFQRRVKIGLGISITVLIICEVLIMLMTFSGAEENFPIVLTNPFPCNIATKIVTSLLCVFCLGAWILPLAFLTTLSSILRHQINTVNVCLQKRIKEEGSHATVTLNDIRVKHLHYTTAIQILDVDMGKYLLTVFSLEILIACFILYMMITDNTLNDISKLIDTFWFVSNLTVIALASITAALLNEKAHAALEHIYNLDLSQASNQEIGNLNMFLSKLNGPAIGFTTMGILTITKELLLTLLGVFATYFFLLLQFHLS